MKAGSGQNLLTGFILPRLSPPELPSLRDAAAAYIWSMTLSPVYSFMECQERYSRKCAFYKSPNSSSLLMIGILIFGTQPYVI